MNLIISVMRKNIISALRGEYLDFIVSRVFFALFTVASATIIFNIFKGELNFNFVRYTSMNNYIGFIIVGTGMFSYTQSIFLNISRALMTERREGTLEALFLAPFYRFKYYCGSLLAQLLLVSIDFFALMIIGFALGISFHLNILSFGLGLLLIFSTLLGISILVSLVMLTLRDTFFVQNTLLPIFLLLGGYLFPPNYLPAPLSTFASLLPLNYGVNLVRRGLMVTSTTNLNIVKYSFYFLESIVFIVVGLRILSYVERYALEKMLS